MVRPDPSTAPPLFDVSRRIAVVRGRKVLLDADLATLYGVPTHRLNEAVKRNSKRFPSDFAFRLSVSEAGGLISQTQAVSQFSGVLASSARG
jgi:hypothetical protein